jgi:diguanylate cyclase (GGDEF)-like protein
VPVLAHGESETCVLQVDLDAFQLVNERYGRPAGDEVLVQVARRLRQAAREHDALFRFGGDEFLILMTCPAGEAADLARRIAARVLTELQRPMSYRTLSNLRINASVGGTVWTGGIEPFDQTLEHAGEALQAAKDSGRGVFRLHAGAMPASAPDGPRLRA